jgi:hypothetical protein
MSDMAGERAYGVSGIADAMCCYRSARSMACVMLGKRVLVRGCGTQCEECLQTKSGWCAATKGGNAATGDGPMQIDAMRPPRVAVRVKKPTGKSCSVVLLVSKNRKAEGARERSGSNRRALAQSGV